MQDLHEPTLGINSWLEDELLQQSRFDPASVDDGWNDLFIQSELHSHHEGYSNGSTNGTAAGAPEATMPPPVANASAPVAERIPEPVPAPVASVVPIPPIASAAAAPAVAKTAEPVPEPTAPPETQTISPKTTPAAVPTTPTSQAQPTTAVAKAPATAPAKPESKPVRANDQLIPLRGAAARIAENMTASLSIPVATSQRRIPVRVIEENRNIINKHRALQGKGKLSFTHLIAWAIVRALKSNPGLNHAFAQNGNDSFRVVHPQVNIGLAVDIAAKDGTRSLKVPNIKNADGMTFAQFVAAYDDIVSRARTNKLLVPDFEGTTISLTNPGTVGTYGSVPRLMPGQGAIIATGAIEFPAEFAAASEDTRNQLGLSKVVMVSCTYDHRIIQGAESGAFLAKLQQMLLGEDNFYELVFSDLKVPFMPLKWQVDRSISPARYGTTINTDVAKEAAVIQLINAYRTRGHFLANTNPLGSDPGYHPDLDPSSYGLTIWDLDRPFLSGSVKAPSGAIAHYNQPFETLREILDRLRSTYSASIGVEYMHIQDPAQKQWLQERMEATTNSWKLEDSTRQRILTRLIQAEEFEHFLQNRFVGQKRFGLEGLESTIVVLDELLERSANDNGHEAVIGMAHRGRLNVLANIVGKSMAQVFSEFDGEPDPQSVHGSGDVKYHLGASGVFKSTHGRDILVSVAFNPSHLEAVDPVVEGLVRPKQDRIHDTKRERVIPILIHGDAAFIGQGVVMEVFQFSQLEGYTTGGTIHIVTNNQIGFTTNPLDGRSSVYCTDVALSVQALVFHVNADDPEACLRVTQIAYAYRQHFKRDVVIDIIGYRRQGHNEADDPSYTQPVMYRKIKATPTVAVQYSEKLVREKSVPPEQIEVLRSTARAKLSQTYDEARKSREDFVIEQFAADSYQNSLPIPTTAVSRETLTRIIHSCTSLPVEFHLHPKLKTLLEKRRDAVNGAPIDWGFAETLAFGSLVLEGTPVRLSGEDVARGTFTQRHLEFLDYESGAGYFPLAHLDPNQAKFEAINSSLSEFGVMGFEFGYSVAAPTTLVMWEAQFGDFVNGAQIIIDQFIVSAESKWNQPSGLVLLLPHGLEGQGPEHSSARIERFLQLCAENNMQVCNCTTPAQYFHLLRRQMHGGADRRGIRKPLIIFTPKSLLRSARAASTLEDLTTGSFQEVMSDATVLGNNVSRILLCSGKVYYDLLIKREELGRTDVAIIRMEQLYPFPLQRLTDLLQRYPDTAEVFWVQEEPENMGPWYFVEEQMQSLLEQPAPGSGQKRQLGYVGRTTAASPAAGAHKVHHDQQEALVQEAFAAVPGVVKKARRLVRKKR
jgi:2-oxoglutarate dehydrogenase E1 component